MKPSDASPSDVSAGPSGDEARYRDLLDRLPETVFEFDLDGRFVYVNRTGLSAFGYTEDDLARGLSVLEMVVPQERVRLRANMARRMAGGKPEGLSYTALRKDGTTFPALVHASVLYRDGHPAGMQGQLIDISERVRGEDDLRRRIALEQIIMRTSNRMVAALAPDELDTCIHQALEEIGRFLAVDRSYVFLFSADGTHMDNTHEWAAEGVSRERPQLQQVPVEQAFPWFNRELRRQHVVPVPSVTELPEEARSEREEFQREGIQSLLCVAMVHRNNLGGFLGLDAVRGQRTFSDDEVALLRVVGAMFMGAIERQRAERALQESEHKYKTLVETTATGFVIIDDRGRVLDANAEYVRMTGRRSLSDIRGHDVLEWTAKHDVERNRRAVDTCLGKGFIRDLQVDYVRPDESIVPVLINATVVDIADKRQIITIIRDMSDRKRLEEEILRSEKLRSVGVLAGGIAHDFNNILTAILGSVSLLQAILHADTQALEHLDEVEKASRRARDLTRQLLTFSRGGEPIKRPFAADPLIRESVTLALRGRASAAEFDLEPELPPIDGDEGQVAQVIRNLVINASQAMEGGGTVHITARACTLRDDDVHGLSSGRFVVITVRDQGLGIPEEHRSRIFDPYFTTKRDGRGLGLAVSHSIVSGHGGAIVVKSQKGQGSAFIVYLPGAKDSYMTPAPVASPLAQGTGRVLVMDDEEAVRQVAGKILAMLGYQVSFARDGREAVAVWEQAATAGTPFDAVIMDLTVPGGMGGLEAMRALLARDPTAKGIVSSGYSQDPVMANHRAFGFREVLVKPYSVVEVSRAIAGAMADGDGKHSE
jgi:PAS domain S-box-containing protein